MELIKLHEISGKRARFIISNIKLIEQIAYKDSKHMLMLQDITSKSDVREYCESENVAILFDENYYMILSQFEVVDFASSRAIRLDEMNEIVKVMKNWFTNSEFSMDCRFKTSYRLLKYFVARDVLTISSEFVWYWGSERMIECMCSFN